jgi:hypothetical protein
VRGGGARLAVSLKSATASAPFAAGKAQAMPENTTVRVLLFTVFGIVATATAVFAWYLVQ